MPSVDLDGIELLQNDWHSDAGQWYKSPHKFELLRILVRIIPFLACNLAAVFNLLYEICFKRMQTAIYLCWSAVALQETIRDQHMKGCCTQLFLPSLITTPDIGDEYLDADAYNEHSKLFNTPIWLNSEEPTEPILGMIESQLVEEPVTSTSDSGVKV